MKALDKSNKLYQQYVEDLTAKETQVEQLFKEASELQRTNRRLESAETQEVGTKASAQ